jgi:hypothetical protein
MTRGGNNLGQTGTTTTTSQGLDTQNKTGLDIHNTNTNNHGPNQGENNGTNQGMNQKWNRMDNEATSRIQAAGDRNPTSRTAETGWSSRAQKAANQNTDTWQQ